MVLLLLLICPGLCVSLESLLELPLGPPLEHRLRPLGESVKLVEREHERGAQRLGQHQREEAPEDGAAAQDQERGRV